MTQALIRRFVKQYENTQDPHVRSAYETLAGFLGILCNLVLFAAKLAAGLLTGSIAVISDAFNNLSDLGSSLVSVIGARLACEEPDEKHPLGHGRIEYIAALSVAGLILVVGLELGKSSVEKLIHPTPVQFHLLTVVLLCGSVLVKVWMFSYNRLMGRRISSQLLFAAAQDSIWDAVATGAVIVATVLGQFVSFPIDAVAGLILSLLILKAGVSVARDTIDLLIGGAPDEKLVQALRALVLSGEGILGVHDLIIHNYGPGRNFATVHAEVSASCDIVRIHEVIDALEHRAQQTIGVTLVIHMDPIDTEDPRLDALRSETARVIADVDDRYAFHDFRMTGGTERINLIFDVVVPFGQKECEYTEKLNRIREQLQAKDPRFHVVMNVDRE